MRKGHYACVAVNSRAPAAIELTRYPMRSRPSERLHHTNLLLQPVYRAGVAHRQRAERCRLHRCARIAKMYSRPDSSSAPAPACTAQIARPDITMYETLLRPHEVSEVPTLLPIGAVSKKLQQSEQKREEKRLRQISNARARHAEKRKREQNGGPEDNDETGSKRVKTEDETRGDAQGSSGPSAQDPASVVAPLGAKDEVRDVTMEEITDTLPQPVDPKALASEVPTPPPAMTQIVSKVIQEVRGHTSYLTFACLLPAVATQSPTCPAEKHESAPSPRTPASQTSDVTAGPSIDET